MKDNSRDLFRLKHIVECAIKIEKIAQELETADAFLLKWIEQDAMLRNFEIIGEAANHLSYAVKEKYSNVEWYKVRGMRNLMAHKYFEIELKIVWKTAIEDIPPLKSQIEKIIKSIEEEESNTPDNY